MDGQRVGKLLQIMEEQVQAMEDLTELCRRKSQTLVNGSLEELDILLRGEQILIWQVGRLEEQRFRLQMDVAATMGLHPAALTLDRLVHDSPPEQAERCRFVADRYGDAVGTLSEVNQLNTELTQQSLAFVDFALQMTGARGMGRPKVYSSEGSRERPIARFCRLDKSV